MFRTLLAFPALTAVVIVLVGTDRRPEFGAEDAEAAALDWVGVERDGPREIEVSVRTRDDLNVEVELDKSLQVLELEVEDPEDE